jgi:hypothetical protein
VSGLLEPEITASEGRCPECGTELGISGSCAFCAFEREQERRRANGPCCKQCGGPMCHSRLYGYYCALNREHKGIVWPGREREGEG